MRSIESRRLKATARIARVLITLLLSVVVADAAACTSAIVSGKVARYGRPLLWKHRDTGTTDNFVARVEPDAQGELAFVGLFNAGDSALSEVWIGMNEAGFAIMNTASYNLMPDTAVYADQEGRVMAKALKLCRTLSDFENMLDTLPKPMGVQANFGAIDATGDGAYYETDDYTYRKYSLSDSPDGVLVRTNFSLSGTYPTGRGYVRFQSAQHLLADSIGCADIAPSLFTDGLSRSFYRSPNGRDLSLGADMVADLGDFIPRPNSSASIVIEGVTPGGDPTDMIMWTAMGYPPVAHTQRVSLDSIPANLLPDQRWHSQECDEAARRKASVYVFKRGDKRFVNLKRLRAIDAVQRRLSKEEYESLDRTKP